jgi:hypothetical protein
MQKYLLTWYKVTFNMRMPNVLRRYSSPANTPESPGITERLPDEKRRDNIIQTCIVVI